MDIEEEAMLESGILECGKTQKEIDDEIKKKKEKQVTLFCWLNPKSKSIKH